MVQNLSTSSIPAFPVTATAAVAWGTDTDWHISFDYKADLSDTKNVKSKLAGGTELLVEQAVALRAGGTFDATNELWWISAGIALLTEKGGVQIVWRRRVAGKPGFDQFFEGGITLFLE